MGLTAGTRVSEAVTLLRPLGRGGMGRVWVGRHERLAAEVAVKFAAPDLPWRDPTVAERFAREAELAARLHGPHVVRAFDHGRMADGRPYLVMELLVGETLGERLAREERLSPAEVVTLVVQLAGALDEAHAAGVVHRDLKPDNVFLVEGGAGLFAKLLDFGIARAFDVPRVSESTAPGTLLGTPEYMSPEQLLATRPAEAHADRWALAVLAYRALVGRVPFSGETLPALSVAICHADHDPPSEVAALPAALDGFFARAFALEPAERFPSAAALSDALAAALADGAAAPDLEAGASPARVSPATRPRRSVRTPLPPGPAAVTLEPPGRGTMSGAATDVVSPREARSSWPLVAGAVGLGLFAALVVHLTWPRSPAPAPVGVASQPVPSRPEPRFTGEGATPGAASTAPYASSDTDPQPRDRARETVTHPSARGDEGPRRHGGPVDASHASVSAAPRVAPAAAVSAMPSASARVKPGCENPFQLDGEGDLVPKPGCM